HLAGAQNRFRRQSPADIEFLAFATQNRMQNRIKTSTKAYPFDQANRALADLRAGRLITPSEPVQFFFRHFNIAAKAAAAIVSTEPEASRRCQFIAPGSCLACAVRTSTVASDASLVRLATRSRSSPSGASSHRPVK